MDNYLNYIEKGSGEPFVLLHGNGESSEYFDRQIEYFSAFRRVIAVDTRGHGKSPRGNRPFTLSQFADDLKKFLDYLGITRTALLGFSDGGNIALIFSLRYPDYVERLILNCANLYPSGMKPTVLLPMLSAFCLYSLSARFNPKAMRKKELLSLMVCEPHIKPKELSAISTPVLVIAGSCDMIRARHTKKMSRLFKNGSLCIVEGTHFIAAENSAAFNESVSRFLTRK